MTSDPQTTPILTFCIAFCIVLVGERRDFKFGVSVEYSKSQPTDDKLSLKGARSHHATCFKFLIPLKEWFKLETSNFVHWFAMWSISLRFDKQCLKWAWSWSRDLFKFWEIIDNISEMMQDRDIVTMED